MLISVNYSDKSLVKLKFVKECENDFLRFVERTLLCQLLFGPTQQGLRPSWQVYCMKRSESPKLVLESRRIFNFLKKERKTYY